MNDRLYRSRTDRVISGVAGGVAERLDVDPSIVRVVWVILAIVSGGAFALVYLVMMIVVPEAPFDAPGRVATGVDPWSTPAATGIRPSTTEAGTAPTAEPGAGSFERDPDETAAFASPGAPPPAAGPPLTPDDWLAPDGRVVARSADEYPEVRHGRRGDRGGGLVLGLILILVGAYFLIREYLPEVDLDGTWPVLVVGAGILLVVFALVPGRNRD